MPSWTYASLKAADTAIAITDPTAAATALNAQTTTLAAQNVGWGAMRDVLMNNFDWGTLVICAQTAVGGTLPGGGTQTAAIQTAAIAIRECCLYGGTFLASVAADWSKLTAAAGLLTPAAAGGISSASSTAIVALRVPVVATWQPAVTAGDVQTARTQ
jgi:hypothetical protein